MFRAPARIRNYSYADSRIDRRVRVLGARRPAVDSRRRLDRPQGRDDQPHRRAPGSRSSKSRRSRTRSCCRSSPTRWRCCGASIGGRACPYIVLMPNMKGFERLEVCQGEGYGANEIILMISSSEKHNLLNFRMPIDEAMREHAAIMARAHALGIRSSAAPARCTAVRSAETSPPRRSRASCGFYLDEGAQTIMLGDTTGVANPRLVRERIGELHGAVSRRRVHRAFPRHARHRRRQLAGRARARPALRGLLHRRHRRPARDAAPRSTPPATPATPAAKTCIAMLAGDGRRDGHRPRAADRRPGGGPRRSSASGCARTSCSPVP